MNQRQTSIIARQSAASRVPRRIAQVFVGASVLASGLLLLSPCDEKPSQVKPAPAVTRPRKQTVACTEEITTSWEWRSLSWHLKSKVLLHQHVLRPALGAKEKTPVYISMSMTIDGSGRIMPRRAYAKCDYTRDCPKEVDIFKAAEVDFDKMKPLPPPEEECIFYTSQDF